MQKRTDDNNDSSNRRSLIEILIESISWIQIMISPFLIGLIIGAIIYLSNPVKRNFIIALLIAILGLSIGIIWATKVTKRRGATNFMSGTMATPELDKQDD